MSLLARLFLETQNKAIARKKNVSIKSSLHLIFTVEEINAPSLQINAVLLPAGWNTEHYTALTRAGGVEHGGCFLTCVCEELRQDVYSLK